MAADSLITEVALVGQVGSVCGMNTLDKGVIHVLGGMA